MKIDDLIKSPLSVDRTIEPGDIGSYSMDTVHRIFNFIGTIKIAGDNFDIWYSANIKRFILGLPNQQDLVNNKPRFKIVVKLDVEPVIISEPNTSNSINTLKVEFVTIHKKYEHLPITSNLYEFLVLNANIQLVK